MKLSGDRIIQRGTAQNCVHREIMHVHLKGCKLMPRIAEDLSGKVFGYLTAIKRVEDKEFNDGSKSIQYLCQCECGNTIVIEARLLKNGKNKRSCGCKKVTAIKKDVPDLTGLKFGHLYVESRYNEGLNGDKWNCVCDCGKKLIKTGSDLTSGHSKSCGCMRYPGEVKIDLSGQKFGRLTVVSRAPNDKTRHIRWFCDCDCGKKNIIVYKDALLQGRQKSCGCLHKEVCRINAHENNRKTNKYDLSGEYGVGYTFNTNNPFYFDLEDYEKIKNYCWREDSNGYIVTNNHVEPNSNGEPILMHRLVMNLDKDNDLEVDHIGHANYDNRKNALRVVSHIDNMKNRKCSVENNRGIVTSEFSYGNSMKKYKEFLDSYEKPYV